MTRHGKLRTREELGLPKWMSSVEGSVDDPPIVMREDWMKHALTASFLLAVVTPFLLNARLGVAIFWGVVIGLPAGYFALMAIRPGVLILDPEGIVVRGLFRSTEYRWADFAGFRVSEANFQKFVVGVHSEEFMARSGWRRILGRSGGFGIHWELPPQKIVDVLNQALARWGPGGESVAAPRK